MADGAVVEGLKLEQRHGKERVRVGRVWKDSDGTHHFAEWNVAISLFSDCIPAYVAGDNSNIVATDTMKNTVYVKAKESSERIPAEVFAINLAKHFTTFYEPVTVAFVSIVEKQWERVSIDGQPHKHGFKLGSEEHTADVVVKKCGALEVNSGIRKLRLLKTTQSGFEGFIRDKHTMLPETRERLLGTEVTASWRYAFESLQNIPVQPLYFLDRYMDVKKVLVDTFFGPKMGVYSPSVQYTLHQMAKAVLGRFHDLSSVNLKMPNIHFLPVNLSSKDNPVIVKFQDDVYLPTDEPHGAIEASLSRIQSKL